MDDRELDVLVAEKVMGFQFSRTEGIVRYENIEPPHYSTEISAAMQVEDRIVERGKQEDYGIVLREIVEASATDKRTGVTWFRLAHATPRQRCQAAIAALVT